MNFTKDLTSLGYREMAPNIWGKPFGHHLLTFEISKSLLTNWFMSLDKQPLIWDSDVYDPDPTVEDDFKRFIIACEAYTNVSHHEFNDFSFLSLTEIVNFEINE